MQRSEGGGLGVGGSASGMMSARGAADLLTRTTTVLAVLFVILSISLAFLAASEGQPTTIDQSLDRNAGAVVAPAEPANDVPLVDGDPLAAAAAQAEAANEQAPADSAVPLDQ